MPLKNAKHELFAQQLVNGSNASEAYRIAGYNDNRAAAARLRQDVRIQQRVAELMSQRATKLDKASEKAVRELSLSKQWVLSRLVQNAESALDRKDGNVANRALELIGKEQGMFIDRKESGAPGDFANMQSADEVLELVRKELGDATANALAAALTKQVVETVADPAPVLDATRDDGSALN